MGANIINLKWRANLDENVNTCFENCDNIRTVNNEIFFTAEIDANSIEQLIKAFNNVIKNHATMFNSQSMRERELLITLFIDSPGGTVKDCFKFIDFINTMRRIHHVHLVTVCTGLVASAGTLIALMGNERYVTRLAICMIHELFGGNIGTYTHMTSGMRHLEMIHQRISAIYLQNNPKLTPEVLKTLLNNETWFSAEDWVDKGFADAIYLEENDQKSLKPERPQKKRRFNQHVRFSNCIA